MIPYLIDARPTETERTETATVRAIAQVGKRRVSQPRWTPDSNSQRAHAVRSIRIDAPIPDLLASSTRRFGAVTVAYQVEYRIGMLFDMVTEQIAVRLPSEQLEVLDDLVDRGVYATRAAAVRAGIDALVELDRRRRDDRSIVRGYQQIPPTEAESAAAFASLREAIIEEPW